MTINMRNGHSQLSTFANKLRANQPTYGTFMMLSSAWTARTVAGCGFDYVIVDCEHGNISDAEMHDSVTAVASSGVSPIVRLRGPDSGLIKRALDSGAHGLMIPMISNADEARAVVQASKFPPVGVRGQGSPFASWAHGITTAEYLTSANDRLMTILQIENAEGVKNAEEIGRVDGVDALFIGPNDLHMALFGSAPANFDSEPFLKVLDEIIQSGRRAGKPVGLLLPNGAKTAWARKRWGDELSLLAVGGDVKALVGWFDKELQISREAL